MKFTNGAHRLDYVPGQYLGIVADDTGFDSALGRFTWYDPPGLYRRDGLSPEVAVRAIDSTHYVATVVSSGYQGTYT